MLEVGNGFDSAQCDYALVSFRNRETRSSFQDMFGYGSGTFCFLYRGVVIMCTDDRSDGRVYGCGN